MRKEQTSHKNEHNTLMCFPLEPVFIRDGEGVPNFMDEPTSGCDKDSMLSVAKLIEEQLKNGTTVLVISHDFEFLANTVSKLWVMGDGKIENVLNMSESNKFLILDKMRGGGELGR